MAQQYIENPYLLDGLKFDLRIYVLLYGVSPLKIYLFDEGLARFATVPYKPPKNSNMRNVYIHLTNYAINKLHEGYQQPDDENGDDQTHKRSVTKIWRDIR